MMHVYLFGCCFGCPNSLQGPSAQVSALRFLPAFDGGSQAREGQLNIYEQILPFYDWCFPLRVEQGANS